MNKGFIKTKLELVIILTVERCNKTPFLSYILFLSALNEVCFTMIKIMFISMETGGFGNGNFHFSKRTLAGA